MKSSVYQTEKKSHVFDFWDCPPDIRETSLFMDYRKQIEAIFDRGEIVTTGSIHRELGTELRHLTLDCIEMMDNIIEVSVSPMRWRKAVRKPMTLLTRRFNNQRPIEENV